MALLRKGITDINTEDPKLINQAVADLKQLYGVCNIKVGDSPVPDRPRGTTPGSTRPGRATRSPAYFYYLPPSARPRA